MGYEPMTVIPVTVLVPPPSTRFAAQSSSAARTSSPARFATVISLD
jgi:hypothetical protein